MKTQDKINSTETKLEAYLKLTTAIATKPVSDLKSVMPISLALFGAFSAMDAQIVYSGTQNVACALAGASNFCFANINLAGGNDFEIHRNHVAAQVFIQVDEVPGGGFDLNGFNAQVVGPYVYPYALAAGAVIGAAGPWGFQAGVANELSDNGIYPNHKWESLAPGTTRFLGMRGTIGGSTKYGWMRLTKNGFGNYTIVDWAYNNTENEQILAGQTTSGTADLSLTMSSNNTTPATGAVVTFTITVSNAGPDAATSASIKNIVPSGLSYVSNSQTGPGTYDQSSPAGTGLRWNNLMISSGSSVTLTFQATVVASSGNITNFVQVQSSAQADPDSTPGNK
jgi:uncharacterized repeat protein (TIGR01451 family)